MKKRVLFAILFVIQLSLVSAQEFKIKPGIIVTRENYKNFSAELKELLPPATFTVLSRGIEKGWITMPIVKKKGYPPPKGLGEATLKYAGTCRTGTGNELIGWTAGLPFYPHPKTGLELAWNAYRRRMHPDDLDMPSDFYLYNKEGKKERSFRWTLYKKDWVGRVDTPPLGEMPGNNGVLNSKESIIITKPFDVKGFCMVRLKYEDIEKPDAIFSYIPAIRRIRRLTGADVTDPLLGSDAIPDDFEVWRAKINSKQTFKILGEKDFLVPRFYGFAEGIQKQPMENFIKGACFQLDWEIRPLWILEIMENDPDYAYSRRVIYIDKEDGAATLWVGENYDQKGRLFRASPAIPVYFNFKNRLKGNWGFYYYNYITGHSTIMDMREKNLNDPHVPVDKFTIKSLLREAR